MKNAGCSSWNRGQYIYWDQKKTISDDDGALSPKAYHLYRWYLIVSRCLDYLVWRKICHKKKKAKVKREYQSL